MSHADAESASKVLKCLGACAGGGTAQQGHLLCCQAVPLCWVLTL